MPETALPTLVYLANSESGHFGGNCAWFACDGDALGSETVCGNLWLSAGHSGLSTQTSWMSSLLGGSEI